MNKKQITIATRESPLALWQANWVKGCLEKAHPELTVNLLGLTTQADKMPFISLAEVGGKGLFVKELEEALLSGRADIAVHCMKDMPVDLPPGLCLPAMCVREDPWDVLISNTYASLDELPQGAKVGTSSLRRQSQLLFLRPDIEVRGLRGNVNTRLAKLDSGEFDAIILAAAGIKRLGFQHRIRQVFDADQFLPAVGQGVLGIECRQDDHETQALVAVLNDVPTYICVTAERAMCRRLNGGCQVPIGAYAEIKEDKMVLRGLVARTDGSLLLQSREKNVISQAEVLGITVADDLLSQGAAQVLHEAASGSGKNISGKPND